ncbi:MAG TPA: transposase [Chitinispirillaceae bacterium]|nr:transposase [Chitinispirillaceae bacterium]
MSTKPRIVAPGVLYLVSSKGVANLDMFRKDEIKTFFLEQLGRTLKKYSFTCHAFSILTNRYHMVLQSDQESISDAMQHFNSIIAKKVNKVLKREGTVFSSRFKSVIVENDRFKELIRNVHLEGVTIGELSLDELANYKFCSHSVILGNYTSHIIDKNTILKQMAMSTIEDYLKYMRDTDSDDDFASKIKDINCGKQGFQKPQLWIIGKAEFVKHVMDLDKLRRLHIARHISEDVKIEKIHDEVVRLLILENSDLYRAGQFNIRSTARELFVSLCKCKYEFSGAEIARYLRITDAAVSRMITRFRYIENRDYLMKRVLEVIT